MDRLTVKSVVFEGHCVLKSMCTFDDKGKIKGEGDCASCGGGCDGFCGECEIQKAFDRLAAYEDTELSPEKIIEMKERLVVDPSGTDKIDELEEAIDFVRFECENLKMENKRLREFIGKTEGNKDE